LILLIDNYDSFTFNLYQYLSELGAEVKVVRNDRIQLDDVTILNPEKIVISPGPGAPDSAGISEDIIRVFGKDKPILGVCLGHQCIGTVFGSIIKLGSEIMHGKKSSVYHDGKGVFKGVPNPFEAIRYHSLVVQKDSIPDCLEITAWTDTGIIMGLRHKDYPIEGVQFHPESIMTKHGKWILNNWLSNYID